MKALFFHSANTYTVCETHCSGDREGSHSCEDLFCLHQSWRQNKWSEVYSVSWRLGNVNKHLVFTYSTYTIT